MAIILLFVAFTTSSAYKPMPPYNVYRWSTRNNESILYPKDFTVKSYSHPAFEFLFAFVNTISFVTY